MPKMTFLRACGKQKLQKIIRPDFTQPYPNVSKMTSYVKEFEFNHGGLRKKLQHLQTHAKNGDCLLKGHLKKPLKEESRANCTDKEGETDNIIIDIDGLRLVDNEADWGHHKITDEVIEHLSEYVVSLLPEYFHGVSYIAHASSSMGLRQGVISLHLDFMLTQPVTPKALKRYLTHLNFEIKEFEAQLELTATGTALRYKLDRSLADNSRLVYIAPPRFALGATNPIANDKDRLILVPKDKIGVDLVDHLNITEEALDRRIRRKVDELRTSLGLPKKRLATQSLMLGQRRVNVATNPDQVRMEYVRHSDDFVYYNVHRHGHIGDSNAYYVPRDNPKVVFNFKGETPFLFEQADPEGYQKHVEQFNSPDSEAPIRFVPLVFRDFTSDTYFNCLLDTTSNTICKAAPASRGALADWMTQHGELMPEAIDTHDYVFAPGDERTVDLEANFINKFVPSAYMRQPGEIEERFKNLEPSALVNAVRTQCPTIYLLVSSATGSDMECCERFLHWLAFIFQRREKTQTAWVLQGTQGTGKGALAGHIIRPLFGREYTALLKLRNLDDQFNKWIEHTLIAAIDEFKLTDSINSSRLFSEIKHLITENTYQMRAMRQDGRDIENYVNMLFFSNEHEVITIPHDDRRFNVCPRQERRLMDDYPDIHHRIINVLPRELHTFAGLLAEAHVDDALIRQPLENQAKKDLAEISTTTIDQFAQALHSGSMDYFVDVLEMDPLSSNEFIRPAQLIVKHWLTRDPNKPCPIWMAELRSLYNVLVGRCETEAKLAKILTYRGLQPKQIKKNGVNKRGYKVKWFYDANSRDALCEHYLSDTERAHAEDKTLQQIAKQSMSTH